MATLREEAEFWRLALTMGLVDKAMVIAWADQTIASLDDPPIQIIDLSLAANRPAEDFPSLLAAVPGDGNMSGVAHQVLDFLRRRIVAGTVSLRHAVQMLRVYGDQARVAEDERLEAANFDDLLAPAEMGHYGTLEGVRQRILEFLEENAPESQMGLVERFS